MWDWCHKICGTILLDYNIRDYLITSILPDFYGWTGRGVSSSMALKSRSCVQFSLSMQFFAVRISPLLASAGPAGTTAPEREQAAPTITAHTHKGECWTIT
jgi:hypothetical protein